MFSKFIQVSAVACALALGGTAVANNNGGTQSQSTQPSQTQQPGQMQQGQQTQTQNETIQSFQLTSLDKDQIKEVQTRLKEVGFYRGTVDGVLGNGTRNGLVSYFQRQASLVQQGRISDQALSGFGFSTNDIQRVRGVDQGGTNNNNNNNNNVNNQRQNTNGQQ